MSVELTLDFAELNHRLEKLTNPNLSGLSALLAAEGETQTRRRISKEKKSSDGNDWAEWSENYAPTRHDGHKILESEGHLLDSIISDFDIDESYWGSNLVQAAALNFGYEKRNLKAREFLYLSEENKQEMIAIMNDWIDELIGA